MKVHTIRQTHTRVSITLHYEPDCEVRLWIRARIMRKTFQTNFHAICLAEKLRAFIQSRLHIAHQGWCGLQSNTMFIPEPVTFSSDMQGVEDAFLLIPIPKCFLENWDGLRELITEEAAKIARAANGRFLVYLPDP